MVPKVIARQRYAQWMVIALFLFAVCPPAFCADAQPGVQNAQQNLQPVFPETNPNIVLVEGEDAVSTNFDKVPRYNFGCSGMRTLQLNQTREPQGGVGFYAEYVFYVEESGKYELWYGGTPPGPLDTLDPSYASPFEYETDNSGAPVQVYREKTSVTENYTPVYYWSSFGEQTFGKGQHTIRFRVKEKRRFDAKYYFYLDCFFLVRKEAGKRFPGKLLPGSFPKNIDSKQQISAFPSIDDCLIAIRDNPEDVEPLVAISRIYTLVGDHISAVKYLKRAFTIDLEFEDVLLLLAKNDIWRNEIDEGLDYYSELLAADPSSPGLWVEAGKVAAWAGKYDNSEDFFTRGLGKFPQNPDLLVNLGLTYLWAGKKNEADETFAAARKVAIEDAKLLKRLGRTFALNGYPDKAAENYDAAIAASPSDIESYLLLAASYDSMKNQDKVLEVRKRITQTFAGTSALTGYVELFFEKLGLKEKAIGGYKVRLAAKPDDLALRETLSQAYFWNGMKREAISELQNILAYYLYLDLSRTDSSAFEYLEALDKLSVCRKFITDSSAALRAMKSELAARAGAFDSAVSANADYAAKKTGKDPSETLARETLSLGDILARIDAFGEKYGRVSASVTEASRKIPAITEKNSSEQKAFEKRIEGIKWTWDKAGYVSELSDVARRGFPLAYNILARIDLADDASASALKSILLADSLHTPELDYSLFETYIRSGEPEKALALFDASGKNMLRSYAPYTEGLVSFVRSLDDASVVAGGSIPATDLKKRATETSALIDRIGSESDALRKKAEDSYSQYLALYKQKLTRGFFSHEESTYLMRNELGDFFALEDPSKAIVQYKKVLAIDPWDIGALFSIGKAYDASGQWQKAQDCYKRVFWADPTYENATGLYNDIAAKHADSIDVSASYLADSASVTWNVDAKYSIELNETIGLELSYEGMNKRIFRWETLPAGLNDYAYTIQSLFFGLPLTFTAAGFGITPVIGFNAALNDRLYTEETDSPPFDKYGNKNITPFDFFEFNNVYPQARLDFSLVPKNPLDLFGSVFLGLQPETLGYKKEDVYEIGGTLNVGTSLSFIDLPVIKNASLRLYGEGHYLLDGILDAGYNIIWETLGEFSYVLIRTEQPTFTLSLFGNVYYQDSIIPKEISEYDKIDYYSPQDVFQTGGGILMNSYIGLPDGNVLGIVLSGGVFYVTQYELYPLPESKQRLKIQADASLEYTRGNGTIYVKPEFVMTPNLVIPDSLWDYWDIYIAVGYTAKIPSLLAE
jgi:tetratricopeptide (TPR) repeat protein